MCWRIALGNLIFVVIAKNDASQFSSPLLWVILDLSEWYFLKRWRELFRVKNGVSVKVFSEVGLEYHVYSFFCDKLNATKDPVSRSIYRLRRGKVGREHKSINCYNIILRLYIIVQLDCCCFLARSLWNFHTWPEPLMNNCVLFFVCTY